MNTSRIFRNKNIFITIGICMYYFLFSGMILSCEKSATGSNTLPVNPVSIKSVLGDTGQTVQITYIEPVEFADPKRLDLLKQDKDTPAVQTEGTDMDLEGADIIAVGVMDIKDITNASVFIQALSKDALELDNVWIHGKTMYLTLKTPLTTFKVDEDDKPTQVRPVSMNPGVLKGLDSGKINIRTTNQEMIDYIADAKISAHAPKPILVLASDGSQDIYVVFSEVIDLQKTTVTDYTIRVMDDAQETNSTPNTVTALTGLSVETGDIKSLPKAYQTYDGILDYIIKITVQDAVLTDKWIKVSLKAGAVKDKADTNNEATDITGKVSAE